MTAYRIIRRYEKSEGRIVLVSATGKLRKLRIRTSDFLAIPRGSAADAPMLPEVRVLQEKVSALYDENERVVSLLEKLCRATGVRPDM